MQTCGFILSLPPMDNVCKHPNVGWPTKNNRESRCPSLAHMTYCRPRAGRRRMPKVAQCHIISCCSSYLLQLSICPFCPSRGIFGYVSLVCRPLAGRYRKLPARPECRREKAYCTRCRTRERVTRSNVVVRWRPTQFAVTSGQVQLSFHHLSPQSLPPPHLHGRPS